MAKWGPNDGLTIQQILNSEGFTLDTSDFPDTYDEEEVELNYAKTVELSNQEMLRLMNLEDGNENDSNVPTENVPFIGIAFDAIKPKMHSVYRDGEILKLIKKEGVGEIVPPDAQVTVEYVGYFEHHDEPFDSTLFHRDKNMVLRLGKQQMIQGLEIAIGTMKKHEKALFIIQPELAYGKLGCPSRIPPDSEVLFKVELINFLDNGSADLYDELNNEEKKKFPSIEKIVRDLMNTAADNYKREKIKQAIREYSRAVEYLERASLKDDHEEEEMNKLLSRALTNLTVCYNKVDKHKLVCANFRRIPTKNGKAYFQHGKALSSLGEYDEAMKSLQTAFKLTTDNNDIRKEIQRVEEQRQKYLELCKQFAQKSLRLTEDNKNNEFEQVAIEMCDAFLKDTVVKQQIPHGLSLEELNCIRRVAASRDLSITKQTRNGVENSFLTKKSYYSRSFM